MLLFIAPISNMFPIHAYNQGVLLILLVYDKTGFFCYCNCYCSSMPKAWESSHFIIQGLPLLNFCFLQYPCLYKLRIILMPSFPLVEQNIQFPPRLWCTIRCVSVCCSTEGLAPSAADQGGNCYDILLHGHPQSKSLEVLSKASLF